MSKKKPSTSSIFKNDKADLTKLLLLMTVSISGGAVMLLELLGTRIIAPFYGVSLYVWSSLISVTMIALAVGYYWGGYLADRYPKLKLPHIITLAALTTVLIPFLSGPIMQLTNPLGLRLGAFVSALLLFSVPLTALAMVGPFVIKLATQDLQGVGRVVGSVYAISTVGSVVATLLLSFFLLPLMGTRMIMFAVSVILLALAIVLQVSVKQTNWVASLPVMVTTIIVSCLAINDHAKASQSVNGFKVQHQQESVYGWVRVVDDQRNRVRLLLSDASVLSATSLDNGQTLLGYQLFMGLLPIFRPTAENALLIGLGGGHIARELKAKGLTTDTIEIDPVVAQASLDYFNFKPTGDFIVGDARYEITKINKKYDIIVHDCFTGGSEPTHLLTTEMLTQLRSMLTQQGVLALNYVGFTRGEGTTAVASVYKTLKQVLPNIEVFVTERTEFTDFIFVASNQSVVLDQANSNPQVQWLLDHQYHLSDNNGLIISDDFNPMESMQVRKSEMYRKVFMERIDPELLFL